MDKAAIRKESLPYLMLHIYPNICPTIEAFLLDSTYDMLLLQGTEQAAANKENGGEDH